uniref:Uncharacterized protein LOC108041566 n=1 Tax=Drosophila rhopaloa TaxID=1041015 RepID=A0A6P4EJ25_DRORH
MQFDFFKSDDSVTSYRVHRKTCFLQGVAGDCLWKPCSILDHFPQHPTPILGIYLLHTLVPEEYLGAVPTNPLNYWQQSLLQGSWNRWHHEYLTTLQQRPKWTTRFLNLECGDTVFAPLTNSETEFQGRVALNLPAV